MRSSRLNRPDVVQRIGAWLRSLVCKKPPESGTGLPPLDELTAVFLGERDAYIAKDDRNAVISLGICEHGIRAVRSEVMKLGMTYGPRAEIARGLSTAIDQLLSNAGGLLALALRQYPSPNASSAQRITDRCLAQMTSLTARAKEVLNTEQSARSAQAKLTDFMQRSRILGEDADERYGVRRLISRCESATTVGDVESAVSEYQRIREWFDAWEPLLRNEIAHLEKLILATGITPDADALPLEARVERLSVQYGEISTRVVREMAARSYRAADDHVLHLGSNDLRPFFRRRAATARRLSTGSTRDHAMPYREALHAFSPVDPKHVRKRKGLPQ